MAKTVTMDGIDLYELRVTRDSSGNLSVHVVFGLLSGSRVIATISEQSLSTLGGTERLAVNSAFNAIKAAIARDQLA